MATPIMDQALADQMVENAVRFCADKKFTGDLEHTRQALQKGRCDACEYLSYSLVKQIGEYLGNMDKTVRAVYAYKPDKAPLSQTGGHVTAGRRASGINLIAWVDRKSAALSSLGSNVETLLSISRRKIGCVNATPACCNLDIAMVDNKEVQEGRGLGTIIQSMYVRSIQVWTRVDQQQPMPVAGLREPFRDLQDLLSIFNPELAPEEMLFEQALAMEHMPEQARIALTHRLEEEKVVLIRRIISDQLAYINIAKEWLTVEDLIKVRRRKIGYGKVGGKAAGLILAARILEQVADESIKNNLVIPESYYLGSDLIYVYMSANGLTHWNDQKYKPEDQIRNEYLRIQEEFQKGEFPPDVLEKLQDMLDDIGPCPIIVRSSSQLEDSFGTTFAGIYDSFFCPNQGTRSENLRALTKAISRTYASTLKPDALLYRRSKGLQDYDERMAILVQAVQGERYGRYYLPHCAGVAFSKNLFRWSPEIRREEGFVRMVWGLGTRAVERVGDDYPHLVALSHPNLQPDDSVEAIRRYSQQYVDLIDVEENTFKTIPVHQAIKPNYLPLRYLVDVEQEGYFTSLRSRLKEAEVPRCAITFKEFIRRTPFAGRLAKILKILEMHYQNPVDLEFTAQILDPNALQPEIVISLLQCRPQSQLQNTRVVQIPVGLSPDEIVFSTHFMVPQGYIENIRYVLFVDPDGYYGLPNPSQRIDVGRTIGKLNTLLPGKSFICVGPGRWGTANPDLGVFVGYGDIHNAAALVELSGRGIGPAPEPSLGTHFFQDLMEAQIYPLVVILDQVDTIFNHDFFYQARNCLVDFLPDDGTRLPCLRLIDLAAYRPGMHLEVVMDDGKSHAIAYIRKDGG